MTLGGFIKLHRRMLDWEWYRNGNTTRVFIHLLLTAAWEETREDGLLLMPGQIVTTHERLAKDLGLSVQNVRTALKALEGTHEINRILTGKKQLITIEKWEEYQLGTLSANRILTGCQQDANRILTGCQQDNDVPSLYEEVNKTRNKERNAPERTPYGEFGNVYLTAAEYEKLVEKYPSTCEQYIERLDGYLEQIGPQAAAKKYKSHYATILNWMRMDAKKAQDNKNGYVDIMAL